MFEFDPLDPYGPRGEAYHQAVNIPDYDENPAPREIWYDIRNDHDGDPYMDRYFVGYADGTEKQIDEYHAFTLSYEGIPSKDAYEKNRGA